MAQTTISVRRLADALLYSSGGRSVKLRIPASAVGDDPAEQLGLAAPLFQDLELSPAAFRNAAAKSNSNQAATRDLIVAASAIEALTSSNTFGSADALFASSFGVLVDDVLLTIVSATELEAAGTVYAYRLALRQPIANAP
ncbi:hypothetical protein JAO29_17525 [Edaphobacter sp. HDX4]|uniref:hypothetical protein n=1 Tax=Edaphobacter sp. HDX4 TaxID=2794064 RepID=UPI002FE5D014